MGPWAALRRLPQLLGSQRDEEVRLGRMQSVRRPVLRVVHSQLTDREALDRIRSDASENPDAARETLDDLREVDAASGGGYLTDRAIRILEAAISGDALRPVSPQHAELYERERQLGWKPLRVAFDELAESVPALRPLLNEIASRSQRGERTWRLHKELWTLVGPESTHPDPLIRSSLAASLAASHLSILEQKPHARDPERSIWEWLDSPADRRHDAARAERDR